MKSLRHFLQNELYNLFHSKSFLFVLLILLLIVTADDILAYKSYKDNLQLTSSKEISICESHKETAVIFASLNFSAKIDVHTVPWIISAHLYSLIEFP